MYEPYYLKDVLDASAQKKFTVISTFAGGGGSSTGYRLAGGDVLLINEFVEEAIETYKANFPDTKVLVDLLLARLSPLLVNVKKVGIKRKSILMARYKSILKICSMSSFVLQKAFSQKSLSLKMLRASPSAKRLKN